MDIPPAPPGHRLFVDGQAEQDRQGKVTLATERNADHDAERQPPTLLPKGVAESASASQETTGSIAGVDAAAKQTAWGIPQAQETGNELSTLAEQLQSIAGQLKV